MDGSFDGAEHNKTTTASLREEEIIVRRPALRLPASWALFSPPTTITALRIEIFLRVGIVGSGTVLGGKEMGTEYREHGDGKGCSSSHYILTQLPFCK